MSWFLSRYSCFARRLALDFTFLSFPSLDCFLHSFLPWDVGVRTCLGLSEDIDSLLVRDWLLAGSETLNLALSSKTWRKCLKGRQAVLSQNLDVPGVCSWDFRRRFAKEFLYIGGDGALLQLRFWLLECFSVMG